MNSCLYECQVMHARLFPKPHRFLYRLFLIALDLDELERLHRRFSLFSVNRRNVFSLHERDFLPIGEPLHCPATPAACLPTDDQPGALKRRVLAFLATRGVDLTGGRVVLVTLPRVFGYHFNPVSFYFCHDRTGTCIAAISEVTNTFREMKPYFLGPGTKAADTGVFRLRTPKFFYVSPYSDVDVDFDFTLRPPGDRLAVQIDDFIGGQRTLTTTLTGVSRTLSGGRLAWYTLKYPLITLRIIALIHWHALRLWLKRVPWYPKAARAVDQRELYRPHASIVSSTDAA